MTDVFLAISCSSLRKRRVVSVHDPGQAREERRDAKRGGRAVRTGAELAFVMHIWRSEEAGLPRAESAQLGTGLLA